MARLAQLYKEEVVPKLMREFGYTNTLAVPKVSKITLNMGVGESAADKKIVEQAATELALIAGQKPIITLARQSVASFKIRVGWPIGCKVTLRQERMYEFLDRLINIAIPRIRDFRGLPSSSFDGSGNYNMGIAEQIAFPEIEYDRVDQLRGLDVNIVTTAITDAEAKGLLKAFNFPFRN